MRPLRRLAREALFPGAACGTITASAARSTRVPTASAIAWSNSPACGPPCYRCAACHARHHLLLRNGLRQHSASLLMFEVPVSACLRSAWVRIIVDRLCFLQVPGVSDRAQPYRPSATVLYTGADSSTARGIARGLFSTTPRTNDARAIFTASAQLTAAISAVSIVMSSSAQIVACLVPYITEAFAAAASRPSSYERSQSPPLVRGDMLSWLGFSLGTSVQSVGDYFFDKAFSPRSQVSRAHCLAYVRGDTARSHASRRWCPAWSAAVQSFSPPSSAPELICSRWTSCCRPVAGQQPQQPRGCSSHCWVGSASTRQPLQSARAARLPA